MDCSCPRLLCPWDFSRQEYRSGLPFPSRNDHNLYNNLDLPVDCNACSVQLHTSPFREGFKNAILREGDYFEVHRKKLGKFLSALELSRLVPELVTLQTRC